MTVDEGPTSRRRRLGAELKRCREAAGMTQEQVSRLFEWHAAKVNRIETARVSVTARDVKDLLRLYEVADGEYRDTLLGLARASRDRAWWAEYRDIVKPDSFIALESEASTMRNWEPVIVPGLLQTEDYMRALFSAQPAGDRQPDVDRAVSLRLARQRRLTGADPMHLSVIVDESVVRRRIGGEGVMAEQIQHLIAMSALPTVTLDILPYDAGEHPLLAASVAVLEFREAPDLDVVYVEGSGRSRQYLRTAADIDHHRSEFDRLRSRCLSPHDRTALLEDQLNRQLLSASSASSG